MKEYFIRTKRLGFSIWSEDNLAEALELWGKPEVTRYITAAGSMTCEEVLQRLQKEIDSFNSSGVQYWPIYLLETDKLAGCCGLRLRDSENNIFEMGIHLKEDYWGKGLAQEACSAVMEYAFEFCKISALFAGHNPKNIASSKLLRKLGFKYTHDEYYEPTGLYHPSYLITRQDYEA